MLGRKRTIFMGSSIMVIGATIQCSSFSLGQLIAGRLITGFGNGMNTSTVPTWQSETSKPHRRGQMVMIEGSMIVFGVMLSYWLDLGFSFLEPSTIAWRFPIAFQIIMALTILAIIPGLPESPRWLILKGKDEKALQVLSALHGLPEDDKLIQDEFQQVQDAVFEMAQGTFQDCFKLNKNRNFHRTALAYVNQMFQQISGINIITYYLPSLLQNDVGLDGFLSRLLAACNGTEYFLASSRSRHFPINPIHILESNTKSLFSSHRHLHDRKIRSPEIDAVRCRRTSHFHGRSGRSNQSEIFRSRNWCYGLLIRVQLLLCHRLAGYDMAVSCRNHTIIHPCPGYGDLDNCAYCKPSSLHLLSKRDN